MRRHVKTVVEGRLHAIARQSQSDPDCLVGRHLEPVMRRRLCPTSLGIEQPPRPLTTCSWMPSLTKGLEFGCPKRRNIFVSLSVNSSGACPSQARWKSPSFGCAARTRIGGLPASSAVNSPLSPPGAQDQVFRNHRCGNRCSGAAAAPRFVAVISIRMSSGPALAYLTATSKYRSPSNIPVSISSYSGSNLRPEAIGLHQIGIRISGLRISIEKIHIRMRRRIIQIIVVFLDVLSVITL